ncbi:hypothetical protein Plo01_19660 [Planobispora longispora]|uniref:Uncharacterized protein n=1 Tax=Planobispora longispora TaxID=28887 RepID=A0A8J3RKL3_9ACTN|nr:hypothetical protein Plo01_19660 [Planobispora longispora]
MVGVSMADPYRVHPFGRHMLEQAGEGGVTEVQEHPEPVVLDEVTAARLTGRRPRPTGSQHGDLHDCDFTDRPFIWLWRRNTSNLTPLVPRQVVSQCRVVGSGIASVRAHLVQHLGGEHNELLGFHHVLHDVVGNDLREAS